MRIDVLTLFPEMFESPLSHSILKRAREAGVVEIVLTNIRDFSKDKHKKVDDRPYGGGPGMVMMCQPVFDCFEHVEKSALDKAKVILLSPQGKPFTQQLAAELAGEKRLILISGHYEGFDERIKTGLGAEQISIGDYVLSGGELAAMVIIDAVVRLVPGLLSHRFYAPRAVQEHAFGVEVRPGTPVKLDGKEHSDARWCTYEEAKAMLVFPANRTALERLDSILRSETSHRHP
jgi:tRNA (guanine-N1)-methyltransferase